MAETIGLASGVIGFIDIAARLTKTAIAIYSTMKDAPDDIKRLKNRSEDLQFILTKINNIPETDQDEKTARYWSEKSKQLVADFAEFNSFAAGLDEHRIKGKVKWYLSKQDRATKLLGLLAEDLKVLKALHQLMMES